MTPRQQQRQVVLTPQQQQRFDEGWADIHRIVATVPKQKVLEIVEAIARLTIQSHQGETKQKKRVWSDANKLAASIRGLKVQAPDVARQLEDVARHLGVGDLVDFLLRFRDAIPRDPLPRAGNSPEARINKARKELAAMLAYYLLTTRTDINIEPTNDADGPYRKLSKAFFEIATGNDFGDLDHVCREVLNSCRERIERRVVGSVIPERGSVVGVKWPRTPRRPRQR